MFTQFHSQVNENRIINKCINLTYTSSQNYIELYNKKKTKNLVPELKEMKSALSVSIWNFKSVVPMFPVDVLFS